MSFIRDYSHKYYNTYVCDAVDFIDFIEKQNNNKLNHKKKTVLNQLIYSKINSLLAILNSKLIQISNNHKYIMDFILKSAQNKQFVDGRKRIRVNTEEYLTKQHKYVKQFNNKYYREFKIAAKVLKRNRMRLANLCKDEVTIPYESDNNISEEKISAKEDSVQDISGITNSSNIPERLDIPNSILNNIDEFPKQNNIGQSSKFTSILDGLGIFDMKYDYLDCVERNFNLHNNFDNTIDNITYEHL